MHTVMAKATLSIALGAAALACSTPADAQRYRGGYRGYDRTGAAVVAGVAGLAVGAALASPRGYYYDPYYGPGYPYYYGYRGYAPHYYGRPYYYGPIYRGYRGYGRGGHFYGHRR